MEISVPKFIQDHFGDVSYELLPSPPRKDDQDQDTQAFKPALMIDYPADYRHVFGLLRAVMSKGLDQTEVSERVLQLTHEAIELNPADYSAWILRRHLLSQAALASEQRWKEEKAYITELIDKLQKNYQVWYHRRAVIFALARGLECSNRKEEGDRLVWSSHHRNLLDEEKQFLEDIVSVEPKNYHAWSYRQWLLSIWGNVEEAFSGEMAFTERMLDADLRNNSAWNHRFFVIKSKQPDVWSDAPSIERETVFAWKYIALGRNNESAWNYLRILLLRSVKELSGEVVQIRNRLIGKTKDLIDEYPDEQLVYAHAFLLDVCTCSKNPEHQAIARAAQEKLIEIDPLRAEYWKIRPQVLTK